MLRCAGRNVPVNRSKIFVKPRLLISLHGLHRIDPLPTSPLMRAGRAGKDICFRSLSTVTTPGRQNASDDKVLPPKVTPRRQGIDLKPGPVKPATLRADHLPSNPSLQPNPSHKKPGRHYHPPRHARPPQPFQIELSAVELAKRDIAEASEQGILEPPPKHASSMRRFIHQAVQLLKFYFRGLKAINIHRRHVSAIRKRVKASGALPTRAEVRSMQTFRQDAFKLVPFMIIVLIAEELIPFVALYFPRMLPSTCVLPGQRNRIALKARISQLEALFRYREEYEAVCKQGQRTGFVSVRSLRNPMAMCSLLGLPAWGPSLIASWRLKQYLLRVSEDDERLRREGHGQGLTVAELHEALLERGM
ncbi:hypothetical protein ID866_7244 [Astraeus odoratus]|nr:hypothetical protein ID866_7244 [Astraeus odoratus]